MNIKVRPQQEIRKKTGGVWTSSLYCGKELGARYLGFI
jgi:hypothetical protein